jgi:hypothetical protein
MSARIALEPVNTAIATAAEYRPRTSVADQLIGPLASPANANGSTVANEDPPGTRFHDVLPPLPAPPDPPGTMFAAAVMAGALSPKPETPEEIFLRLGGAWSPPDSELHLKDRKI